MFKNVVYIGENEALSILHGTFAWRYWLKRPRRNRKDFPDEDQSLPARQLWSLHGVEWFVYNQSAAYNFGDDATTAAAASSPASSATVQDSGQEYSQFEQALFSLMPISVVISEFAMIFGNTSTSTLLVGYCPKARAEIDITAPTVAADRYKMVYNLKMQKPLVKFVANRDFNAKRRDLNDKQPVLSLREVLVMMHKHSRFGKFKHHKQKVARAKFSDDTPTDHELVSKLLSCDSLEVKYYYDVPDISTKYGLEEPKMGYDITVYNTVLNYGPWAERKRGEFYDVFFPQKCRDYVPVVEGFGKVRTIHRTSSSIRFDGHTAIRAPLREISKLQEQLMQEKEHEEISQEQEEAPYGWFELYVQSGSEISWCSDVVPQPYGMKFAVDIKLLRPQLRTSVNHSELLSSDSFSLHLDQLTHLKWNQLQYWNFKVDAANPKIFLLREHINLLIDLSADFASSPNVQYERFIPTVYNVDLSFEDLELYLNVNPQNIISNPTLLAVNAFLIFKAPKAYYTVSIPLDQVSPVENCIKSQLRADTLTLDISTPSWHTLDAFLDCKTVGIASDFVVDNCLSYRADVDFSRVETNVFDIQASKLTLVTFGFVIDYLVTLINNYGGTEYRFQTIEEFLARENKEMQFDTTRSEVDMDIRFISNVRNCRFVFPKHIYSATDSLDLCTDLWSADLRLTNYYMDLQTEFSPVEGYVSLGCEPFTDLTHSKDDMALHTDEFIATAHRMFGLPPAEPTYICKWDFSIGDIGLNFGPEALALLTGVLRSFLIGFDDAENKPQVDETKLNDVTFVTATTGVIDFRLRNQLDSILVQTSSFKIKLNDLGTDRYDGHIFIDIPGLKATAFSDAIKTLDLTTDFRFSMFVQAPLEQNHKLKQQDHLMQHDSLFHRCAFFLDEAHRYDPRFNLALDEPRLTPAMPIPEVPPQLTRETLLIVDPDMGQFSYKPNKDQSGSEASLYGSDEDDSSTSEEGDSDGSRRFIRNRARAESRLPQSRYLAPLKWRVPVNPFRGMAGRPEFPNNHTSAISTPPRQEGTDIASLVGEVGEVSAEVHPELVNIFARLGTAIDKYTSYLDIIDDLQSDVVKELSKRREGRSLKYLINVPLVKLSIGGQDSAKLYAELTSIQLIGEAFKQGELGSRLEMKLRSGFERVFADVRENSATTAVRMELYNPELIFSIDKDAARCVEVTAGTVDLTQEVPNLDIFKRFFRDMYQHVPRSGLPATPANKLTAPQLIYSLVQQGAQAKIEHDSYVLSRSPPGHSKNYIRGDISWRLIIRLRYLLAHMPDFELLELSINAKQEVISTLSGWRSWERVDPLDDARIFNAFDEEIFTLPQVNVSVESISFVLKYSESREDYFVLDELELRGGLKKPRHGWTKIHLAVTSHRARLGLGWDVLPFIVEMGIFLREFKELHTSSQPGSPAEPKPAKPWAKAIGYDIFQAILLFSIRDWSAEVRTPSTKWEFQNRDVQLVSTVNYQEESDSLFSSGVLASSQSAIRVFSPDMQLEVADYLMEKLSIGFCLDSKKSIGPVWLVVKVDTLKLALNATFEKFLNWAKLIIDRELVELKQMHHQLVGEHSSSGDESSATKNSSQKPMRVFPHGKLDIASFVFKVKIIDDLLCLFSGTGFNMSCRQPNIDAMLTNIEWSSYELRLQSEVMGGIGSFLVEKTKILLRTDTAAKAIDLNYAVGKVGLETTSILTLLKYVQSPKTVESFNSTKAASSTTFNAIDAQKDAPAQSEGQSNQQSYLLNAVIDISLVRILLPVEEFSFEFVFDNISLHHNRFKWLPQGIEPNSSALTFGSFDELSSVLVHPQNTRKVFSIQLLGSYKGKAELSSIYFTSDFCSVALCPTTLCSTIVAIDKVKSHLGDLIPGKDSTSSGGSKNIVDLLAGYKAAIAFRELSITWLTENPVRPSEGISAGFELLQINLIHHQCRMDLVGFNVTPSDCRWKSLSRNKFENFTYLPHVEITGVLLKEEKFIYLTINGEKLHVNLKPNIGLLLSSIITSVNTMQEFLEKIKPKRKTPRRDSLPKLTAVIDENQTLFEHSVRLNSKFDAAVLKLWDDSISGAANSEVAESILPALELSSPNIQFNTEYWHREDNRRDSLAVIVKISRSSNQIFPKCLPELRALFANFSSFREPREASRKDAAPSSPISFGEVKGEVISRILRRIDITVDIRLDTQELTASSQPYSKVTTTISTQSLQILASTPVDENNNTYIALWGTMKGARLLLQHAHSHERTGFGEVGEMNVVVSHNVSKDFYNHPFRIGVVLKGITYEVKAPQIGDIRLFLDIWNPRKGETPQPDEEYHPPKVNADMDQSLGSKYQRLLTSYPMSVSFNLTVEDVACKADLGLSLGQLHINVDRLWSSFYRNGNVQSMATGIDQISVASVGRFAGQAVVNGFSKRVTAFWDDAKMMPLLQIAFGIKSTSLNLGMDGHEFLAVEASFSKLAISNQHTLIAADYHKLLSFIQLGDIHVAITTLVASNIYDVFESLKFIKTQSVIYEKTMVMSNSPTINTGSIAVNAILSRLWIEFMAEINGIHLFVLPTSFEDTTALKARSDQIKIYLSQNPLSDTTTKSNLQVDLTMVKVGLYSLKPSSSSNKTLFQRLSRSANANTLFNIPKTLITMNTTDYDGVKVEYIFRSLFEGDLEIGWNLGTINFIKEMYETHKRTWLSRIATKVALEKTEADPEDLALLEKRPEYIAVVPPDIQIPHLHDMGVATPPVEWMGFNRERLPGLTHWFVIRALNEIVKDIEKSYSKLLL